MYRAVIRGVIIIIMAEWLSHYDLVSQRVQLGSIVLTSKDYPLTTFLMGCLFQKIPHIQSLFELFQILTLLRKRKLLSLSLYKQFLSLLHEDPLLLPQTIITLLNIKDKDADPQTQFQLLNICSNIHKKNQETNNKTKDSKASNEEVSKSNDNNIGNTMNTNNAGNTLQRTKTVQYEQTPILQQQAIDEQKRNDEEFARKIQQQQLNEMNEQKQECQICYEDLYSSPSQPMQNCSHIFHRSCLLQSFKTAITSNIFPLRCLSCLKEVTSGEIRRVLPPQWYQKYTDNSLKHYAEMHGDSVSWCPTADCKYLFFFEKQDGTWFRCEDCKKNYCLECRVEWHDKMTCKEYQITHTNTKDDEKFLSFVKGKKFKQCPKCKYWVEKNTGCDHMTCKCTFQFCYKCGGVYMKCQCVEKQKIQIERRKLAIGAKKNKKQALKKQMKRRGRGK